MVSFDDSQFGFVPGRGTTGAIFVVPQLHEKYLIAVNKRLYISFVNLEKAFDHVPRKVTWGALRKLGTVLRNGLCSYFREYTPMCEVWCLLTRVIAKSLRRSSGSTGGLVLCSTSLCRRLYHMNSILEFPWRTFMQMILSSLLTVTL